MCGDLVIPSYQKYITQLLVLKIGLHLSEGLFAWFVAWKNSSEQLEPHPRETAQSQLWERGRSSAGTEQCALLSVWYDGLIHAGGRGELNLTHAQAAVSTCDFIFYFLPNWPIRPELQPTHETRDMCISNCGVLQNIVLNQIDVYCHLKMQFCHLLSSHHSKPAWIPFFGPYNEWCSINPLETFILSTRKNSLQGWKWLRSSK